jgi:hypothetical protein
MSDLLRAYRSNRMLRTRPGDSKHHAYISRILPSMKRPSVDAQSDLICAPRPVHADKPPTVQIGGSCARRSGPEMCGKCVHTLPICKIAGALSSDMRSVLNTVC